MNMIQKGSRIKNNDVLWIHLTWIQIQALSLVDSVAQSRYLNLLALTGSLTSLWLLRMPMKKTRSGGQW